MKNIIAFLVAIVFLAACDKDDKQLKSNSLIITKQSEASGCLGKNRTKTGSDTLSNFITLEAKGNTLLVYRKGEFNCGALIQLSVSNEGNTITIHEVNKRGMAYCGNCIMESSCEIDGMKEGVYVIVVRKYFSEDGGEEFYDPIRFTFEEGARKTVDLGYI